jgi:hypothetical protein
MDADDRDIERKLIIADIAIVALIFVIVAWLAWRVLHG